MPTHTMLGRSVGLSEEKIRHLASEEPPEGVYTPAERAIVSYARKSTSEITIDDETYAALEACYTRKQIMEIWGVVSVANSINRFHATFHTDVDEEILETVEAGDRAAGGPALQMPAAPGKNGDTA